ncbi:protein of unknown function [Pararobbsia alpina]
MQQARATSARQALVRGERHRHVPVRQAQDARHLGASFEVEGTGKETGRERIGTGRRIDGFQFRLGRHAARGRGAQGVRYRA